MFRIERIILNFIRPIVEKELKKELKRTIKVIELERNRIDESILKVEEEASKRIEFSLNQALEKITIEGNKKTDEITQTAQRALLNFIQQFGEISEEIIKKIKQNRGDEVKVILDGENFREDLRKFHLKEEATLPLKVLREKETKIGDSIFFDSRFPGRFERSKEKIWKSLRRDNVRVITGFLKVMVGQEKSFVDPQVITEIVKTIGETQYGRIILFAGDSDYSLPVREVKKWGIKVTAVCSRESLSRELKEVADVLDLEDLIPKE